MERYTPQPTDEARKACSMQTTGHRTIAAASLPPDSTIATSQNGTGAASGLQETIKKTEFTMNNGDMNHEQTNSTKEICKSKKRARSKEAGVEVATVDRTQEAVVKHQVQSPAYEVMEAHAVKRRRISNTRSTINQLDGKVINHAPVTISSTGLRDNLEEGESTTPRLIIEQTINALPPSASAFEVFSAAASAAKHIKSNRSDSKVQLPLQLPSPLREPPLPRREATSPCPAIQTPPLEAPRLIHEIPRPIIKAPPRDTLKRRRYALGEQDHRKSLSTKRKFEEAIEAEEPPQKRVRAVHSSTTSSAAPTKSTNCPFLPGKLDIRPWQPIPSTPCSSTASNAPTATTTATTPTTTLDTISAPKGTIEPILSTESHRYRNIYIEMHSFTSEQLSEEDRNLPGITLQNPALAIEKIHKIILRGYYEKALPFLYQLVDVKELEIAHLLPSPPPPQFPQLTPEQMKRVYRDICLCIREGCDNVRSRYKYRIFMKAAISFQRRLLEWEEDGSLDPLEYLEMSKSAEEILAYWRQKYLYKRWGTEFAKDASIYEPIDRSKRWW